MEFFEFKFNDENDDSSMEKEQNQDQFLQNKQFIKENKSNIIDEDQDESDSQQINSINNNKSISTISHLHQNQFNQNNNNNNNNGFNQDDQEESEQQKQKQEENQNNNAILQKKANYTYILQNQVYMQLHTILLGEIMIDFNLFNSRGQNNNNQCEYNEDYPWNAYRPASKIQNFQDGSILSYHDSSISGRLVFYDILELLNRMPDQNAHRIAEKLEKYQQKLIKTQQILKELKEYYSEEDLTTIFTEIQRVSLEKAMKMLDEYNKQTNSNQIYMYGIHTVNPNTLQMTPIAIGQSKQLVELMGESSLHAYKVQMLRKGFLNFDNINSHLQMLLLSLNVEKSVFLQARTIEGFSLPMNISIENHILQSIKLNPINYSFNTVLTFYQIDINPNILQQLQNYRQNHVYEGLPDDLSYMLDCQVFITKHYKEKFDLSNERRCHYKLIQTK